MVWSQEFHANRHRCGAGGNLFLSPRPGRRCVGMIEEIDSALEEWASSVVHKAAISFGPPAAVEEAKGVNLYLLQIAPAARERPARGQPPLRAALHYLVTSWAKDPREMHQMLGELLFAAMENPKWEVESESPSCDVWKSLGLAARPAFILKAFALKERVSKTAPMVTQRMEILKSPMRTLDGLILGPDKEPIMGAAVEVPALNLVATTDYGGRFRFLAIPAKSPIGKVRVNVKGRALEFPSVSLPDAEEPLVLQLNNKHLNPEL